MIRTLKTYCVYDPAAKLPMNFCSSKKAAAGVVSALRAIRGIRCVIVPMKGTYAYTPPHKEHGPA